MRRVSIYEVLVLLQSLKALTYLIHRLRLVYDVARRPFPSSHWCVCSKQVRDAFSSQSSASLTVSGADSAETLQRVAKFLQQLDILLSDVVKSFTNSALLSQINEKDPI